MELRIGEEYGHANDYCRSSRVSKYIVIHAEAVFTCALILHVFVHVRRPLIMFRLGFGVLYQGSASTLIKSITIDAFGACIQR